MVKGFPLRILGPLMGVRGAGLGAMPYVLVAYFLQCHMSNLRKGYVTYHYDS